jgi:hypothetical protein
MKLYPTGVMEGSPEELAQYQKLMQAKPEQKAPIAPRPWPLPQVGSGFITLDVSELPPLWNGQLIGQQQRPIPNVVFYI